MLTLQPYGTSVCAANSSTFLKVVESVVMVRNAAKLAVYDDIMINVNSHHAIAMILVDGPLGIMSHPINK